MRWAVHLLLALIICLAIGMTAWAETVHGVVRREGRPVPDRQVFIGDNQALTDRYGNFAMWLDPGEYPVRVQGFGNCQPQRVRVRPGERTMVEIQVSQ